MESMSALSRRQKQRLKRGSRIVTLRKERIFSRDIFCTTIPMNDCSIFADISTNNIVNGSLDSTSKGLERTA